MRTLTRPSARATFGAPSGDLGFPLRHALAVLTYNIPNGPLLGHPLMPQSGGENTMDDYGNNLWVVYREGQALFDRGLWFFQQDSE
uniref:Uncharacterized protein n=1 Tax=Ralstonia phage BOESR1 TaxID=3034917 RepID=A0AA49EP88_9CAUD|nr:hypothetical protein HIBIKMCM_00006 [Ralstonia phage BOESR1]